MTPRVNNRSNIIKLIVGFALCSIVFTVVAKFSNLFYANTALSLWIMLGIGSRFPLNGSFPSSTRIVESLMGPIGFVLLIIEESRNSNHEEYAVTIDETHRLEYKVWAKTKKEALDKACDLYMKGVKPKRKWFLWHESDDVVLTNTENNV